MSDTRAYQSAAGAALGMTGKFAAANNSLAEKVAEPPRLEAIANQYQQAQEVLAQLTMRAGRVADKLLGSRPPVPERGEAVDGGDHSSTHRLQRHGREMFATLEMMAGEISRLEEL